MSSGEAALARTLIVAMLLMLLLGIGMGWFISRKAHSGDLTQDTGPVVLAIQQIGQLHSASFTMKDAIRQETVQEPQDWAQGLPGATEVIHWATHNQAVVVAEGSVEAGLDLRQITGKDVTQVRRPDGRVQLRVHLPPIVVYPPTIHLQVESNEAGWFWRDENIVPKAQKEAERRFVEAAEKEHIRERAQSAAISTLQQTLAAWGQKDIEFFF
ncbi:MAG TPA: DUF4230 domain-containing protein [Chthonomonadaceae bacterium]|nr:DUF4230 domain-containing protein [Chthonomonadaceae bacterium]